MQTIGLKSLLLWLTLFSVAMGFLECAVVIYLREIYYPLGFTFPLTRMSDKLAFTEFLREVSTLIMLFAVAWIGGKNNRQRFAWFIYCFAIWDIFYYVFLKILIGWPDSFFTWDILFLIPVIWTGPVLAPVIVSISMIFLAAMILIIDDQVPRFEIGRPAIMIIFTGAFLIFLSFTGDYSIYILEHNSISGIFQGNILRSTLQHYVPVHFNWWLLMLGEVVLLTGMVILYLKSRRFPSRDVNFCSTRKL